MQRLSSLKRYGDFRKCEVVIRARESTNYLLSLGGKIMQENTCQQLPHSGKENHLGAQKMALWSRAHTALIEDPI